MKTELSIFRKMLIALPILAVLSTSCTHYFNVVVEGDHSPTKIKAYESDGKYFVLRRDSSAWHLYDVAVLNDTIYAKIDYQLGYMAEYLSPKLNKNNRFSKQSEPEVINSVHLFTNDYSYFDYNISIPLSKIYAIQFYQYNKKASVRSYVLPAVIITVTGTAIVLICAVAASTAGINNAIQSSIGSQAWHIK